MADNIVNWGLVQSAWAPITVDANGNDTYGTVKTFRGARSISFTANGEMSKVYADGTTVYIGRNNNGYTGTMEFTVPDEDFLAYILSEAVDANGVQYEETEPTVKRFALLWEWEGDQRKTRHVMYNCTASRPDLSATTKGDGGSKSAQYQTITIEAVARPNDDVVKARSRSTTTSSAYNAWFTTVPTIAASGTQTVTVTVTGTDSAAVSGALVVLGDGSTGYTDSTGVVVFHKAAGTYDLMVSASGYTAATSTVTVASAAVTKSVSLTASE